NEPMIRLVSRGSHYTAEIARSHQIVQKGPRPCPHISELPGGVDSLALIHPAVDIVVAADDGPGEGLNRGGVIGALAARREQRFGGRRHEAEFSIITQSNYVQR